MRRTPVPTLGLANTLCGTLPPMKIIAATIAILSGGLLLAADAEAASRDSAVAPVDFAHDIRPLFNKNCVGCHGGVKRAGKISFIYRDQVVATDAAEEKVIHPGDPEHSELIRRVT